jgi:O-acetyl-ADP-ribose deacetylase (regulator of RNase III)
VIVAKTSTAQFGTTVVRLVQGNIVQQKVDAIVNAANSSLLGGGGVDGAIHRAGGPMILEDCQKIRAAQGGCKAGDAVITRAGKLDARHVIHTVGPVWQGGKVGEPETLANAYRRCLEVAKDAEVRTIAFPAISTGIYGYPLKEAAIVALETVSKYCTENVSCFDEIMFVLFGAEAFDAYSATLEHLLASGV